MRHATQNFDFPTCSDENFWIFLRGATRRARLAPNRVKRRDRKIQLSSTASCSSPLIAPPPVDCGRPGAHAVDASERRPRPTSCASSARHAATAGPGRRSHAATMPYSASRLSSPRPAPRPPGARSASRWRGARGDRGAARRRSARVSRAGAAAREVRRRGGRRAPLKIVLTALLLVLQLGDALERDEVPPARRTSAAASTCTAAAAARGYGRVQRRLRGSAALRGRLHGIAGGLTASGGGGARCRRAI